MVKIKYVMSTGYDIRFQKLLSRNLKKGKY
jgi:hypothetical protein